MATPKIIPYTVKLRSVVPEKTFSKPPVVYTNDLRSAEFQFKITDMDASELLTATAKTMLYMRDGSFFQNPSTDVSRVGNVFSYLLKENEGNHAGIAKIQLVVYFNEGLADEQNFPTQLYEFEIINGLETKVAQEVMIYDWTTLTRDAQDYIDTFSANEVTRQQQFADAQTQRTTGFGAAQTSRTETFAASEQSRTDAFGLAESARAEGYTADHGRAETDHTTAAADHTTAGTDHTTAAADHTLAASDHTTAAADHTMVQGYNTRLQAEETATANNKISAVKGKTFADVDARLEDVETDTTMMGTNLVTNGDFSNGVTGFTIGTNLTTVAVANNELSFTGTGYGASWLNCIQNTASIILGHIYYQSLIAKYSTVGGNVQLGMMESYTQISLTSVFQRYTSRLKAKTSNYKSFTLSADSGATVVVKNAFVLDLTAIFGEGNEPTAEQMDGIMAKFTNSWFNGTANLFRANATLNKLMAVDARTEFDAKNALVNGNFTTASNWTGNNATFAVANNIVTITASGTTNYGDVFQNSSLTNYPANNKIYAMAKMKALNAECVALALRIGISGGGTIPVVEKLTPVSNQQYTISGITSAPTSGILVLYARHQYIDAATATGKTAEVQYVTLIDLTATFGAGKEPTLAEMDRLMARYPNSWFDGTKPIQTIETLYQEKANKVQEAWITPTLINGWKTFVDSPLQYRKDEFGVVHFRGRLDPSTKTAPDFCTLPAGYRPMAIAYVNFAGSSYLAFTPTGSCQSFFTTWQSLEMVKLHTA